MATELGDILISKKSMNYVAPLSPWAEKLMMSIGCKAELEAMAVLRLNGCLEKTTAAQAGCTRTATIIAPAFPIYNSDKTTAVLLGTAVVLWDYSSSSSRPSSKSISSFSRSSFSKSSLSTSFASNRFSLSPASNSDFLRRPRRFFCGVFFCMAPII